MARKKNRSLISEAIQLAEGRMGPSGDATRQIWADERKKRRIAFLVALFLGILVCAACYQWLRVLEVLP